MPKRQLVRKGIPGSARPLARTLVISFAAAFVMALAGIWYTNYEARRTEERIAVAQREAVHQAVQQAIVDSNRKWCGIVVFLDETYKSTPAATPLGQKIASYYSNLRKELQCP